MTEKEFKKKWIKNLRSGDFAQGRDMLCKVTASGAEYCCLGVACETWHGEQVWVGRGSSDQLVTKDGHDSYWAPPFDNPVFAVKEKKGKRAVKVRLWEDFATLNDDLELSFEEIADLLEHHWI